MRRDWARTLRRARTRSRLAYDWFIFEIPLHYVALPGVGLLFDAIIAEYDKPIQFMTGVANLAVVAAIVWRRLPVA